jgi:hypothetical protein
MAAVTAPTVPDLVSDLLGVGGEDNPWLTIPDALPYLPVVRKKAYVQAKRYLDRIERERKRRRSYLLPAEMLDARENELPCRREGRTIMLDKQRLVEHLRGYRP